MKVKVEKYVYKRIADIFVKRIDCTAQNILQLISVFNFGNILAIIDSEDDLSPILLEMKQMGIKYTTAFSVNNSPITNVVLLCDPDKFKKIITDAFQYNLEGIFLTNVNDQNQWEQYLYNSNYIQSRKLVKNKYSDLSIGVSILEYEIGISLDNKVYDASLIVSKIKELF
ncbi:hypothetical protein SH2C18_15260 [Clostridium sediminicola]|uniref:hypothetical protein n=1 Tax=Clostridium sediminicola TaxID=3114879 RepID=UPI0031F2429F